MQGGKVASMPRVLITGGSGQLGACLAGAVRKRGWTVSAPGRAELNLADLNQVDSYLSREHFDLILNAGAYTAVDKAEEEQDMARLINAECPALLARHCKRTGARLLHIGTDYVFAGWQGERRPLIETDTPCPAGVYAITKNAGEQAVLQEDPTALVARTSGVYHPGGVNFPAAILKRLSQTGEVQVVDDQFTLPTPAKYLAQWCLSAIGKNLSGLLHLVPTGAPSWYEVSKHIVQAFTQRTGNPAKTSPMPSAQLQRPAPRPPWSVLSNAKASTALGLTFPTWEACLSEALADWPMEGAA